MSFKTLRLIPESLYKIIMDKEKESKNLQTKLKTTANSKEMADDIKALLVQDLLRQIHQTDQKAQNTPILVQNVQEKTDSNAEPEFSTELLSPRGLRIFNFLKSNGMQINNKEVMLDNLVVPTSNAGDILKALTSKNAPITPGFEQVKQFLLAKKAPKSLFTPGVQAKLFGSTKTIKKWSHY